MRQILCVFLLAIILTYATKLHGAVLNHRRSETPIILPQTPINLEVTPDTVDTPNLGVDTAETPDTPTTKDIIAEIADTPDLDELELGEGSSVSSGESGSGQYAKQNRTASKIINIDLRPRIEQLLGPNLDYRYNIKLTKREFKKYNIAQSIEAKKKSHHGKLKSVVKGAKLHPESSEDNSGTKKQVLGFGGMGQNAGPPGNNNFGDEPMGSLGGALANGGGQGGPAGLAGLGDGEARGFEGPEGLAAANGLGGGGPGGMTGLGGLGGLGGPAALGSNALGGLGGETEGVPTGMGAGGEPLGFAGQGQGSPFGGGGMGDLGLGGGGGGGQSQEGPGDNFDQGGEGGLTGGLGSPLGAGGADGPGLGEPVGNPMPASNFQPNQGTDSSETAALAREAVQDNNALGELVKNADKIQDDSPGDPPPEGGHSDSAASVTSANDDAAQLQNLASDEAAGFKSSQGTKKSLHRTNHATPIGDVEATSMNGAQAVLGMQGQRSMKRYTLKKAKKGSKKSKHSKRPKAISS